MCKYANNRIVKVSTDVQVNTIKRVLSAKTKTNRNSVPNSEFDKNLWFGNGTKDSIIRK